jgi:hypothetical protein
MQKLDGKFHGVIARDRDGQIVPPDQYVVFLARDNAFLPTLKFYYDECDRQGAAIEQLEAISRLIIRVEKWRKENPDLCKLPDAAPGECQ